MDITKHKQNMMAGGKTHVTEGMGHKGKTCKREEETGEKDITEIHEGPGLGQPSSHRQTATFFTVSPHMNITHPFLCPAFSLGYQTQDPNPIRPGSLCGVCMFSPASSHSLKTCSQWGSSRPVHIHTEMH